MRLLGSVLGSAQNACNLCCATFRSLALARALGGIPPRRNSRRAWCRDRDPDRLGRQRRPAGASDWLRSLSERWKQPCASSRAEARRRTRLLATLGGRTQAGTADLTRTALLFTIQRPRPEPRAAAESRHYKLSDLAPVIDGRAVSDRASRANAAFSAQDPRRARRAREGEDRTRSAIGSLRRPAPGGHIIGEGLNRAAWHRPAAHCLQGRSRVHCRTCLTGRIALGLRFDRLLSRGQHVDQQHPLARGVARVQDYAACKNFPAMFRRFAE